MYQSISSIEHLFFSFPSDFFIINPICLCFDLFESCSHSLESYVAFHFVSEFLFFVLFCIMWMLTTVNKAKFSLRKILITLVKSRPWLGRMLAIQISVKKNNFLRQIQFLKNNGRRVSNRLRLFIIKPFHILTIKI